MASKASQTLTTYLLVELDKRGQELSRNLGRAAHVVGELCVRIRHALAVLGRLELFGWHGSRPVTWHWPVVAISDLFKFNMRYFLVVDSCAVVIGGVTRKFREVGGHA